MKKIMVVDNDRIILRFMTKLLEKEGYQVVTAADGLNALDILKTYTPDVIFVDLVMPNIDGEALCRLIRDMPKLKDVYLIILSAITVEERTDISQFGANVIIAKGPFNEMAQHVLYVLNQPDLASSRCLSGEVFGIKSVYPRGITKELLSIKKHFEIILKRMSEGILEITSEGRIVSVNPAALLLINKLEKELLGSSFVDLFSGDDRRRVGSLMKIKSNKPKTITEDAPVRLNGHQVTLNILSLDEDESKFIVILSDVSERKLAEEALRKAHNELEKRVEERTAELTTANEQLNREIDERKQAEAALRESEERFRAIFEGAVDGILAADIETTKFVFANPRICQITGYSSKELLGLDVAKIHPEKDLPYVMDQFTKLAQEKINVALDVPVLRKDKAILYCDICGKIMEIGNNKYVVGFFRDITERKLAEEALRESEDKYKRLTENSLTGVFIHQNGRFVFVNGRFAAIHGYTPEELLGKDYQSLICPDEREEASRKVSKRMKKEPVTQRYELERLKKDGTTVW